MRTLKRKYADIIQEISDERDNGDGIWVYLKKEWADFAFDPWSPTRQIHEQTEKLLLDRFAKGRIRKISDQDFYNYPNLRY